MKITRMDIKGFGRFRQATFEPGPGLNLVHGPNEAGKSTLLAYIGAMLYGLRGGRRSKDGELPPLRRYEPWQGDVYAGVLEYSLDDGTAFRIGRNFSKGAVHVQDGHANDITARFPSERETGPQFAEAQLGVDAETFARTLFVGQMKTVLDAPGRRHVMDSLLRMQDAGRDEMTFRQAEDAIQKALLERVGSERSTVRPMDRIQNRLAELEADAESIRRQREAVRETAMALAETKMRLNTLRIQQAATVEERDGCRTAIREEDRYERMEAVRRERERLKGLSDEEAALTAEAAELASRLADRSALASIDEAAAAQLPFDLGRRRELLRAVAHWDDEIARKRGEALVLESELPQAPVWRDAKRLDAVLQEYLILREQVGSAEERGRILEELNTRKTSWPPRILGAISFVMLAVLLALFAAGVFFPGAVPAGGPVFVFLTILSCLSVAAAIGIPLSPLLRQARHPAGNHTGRGNGSAPSEETAGREDILRWNRARVAFDDLIAETGVPSVQEFLRIKSVVDTVGSRRADLVQDMAELSERREKSGREAEALSVRTADVMRAAGFFEDDGLDAKRMQAFHGVLQAYRDDRNRAAEVNMRLEAMQNERNMLLRSVAALEEAAAEEVPDFDGKQDSAPGDARRTASGGKNEDIHLTGSVDTDEDTRRKAAAMAAGASVRLPVLQAELEHINANIAAAQLTEATLETRLERAPAEDRLQQALEEADRLEARRESLHAYGESLRMALETLRESALALRQGVSPKLDGMTGEILSVFTGGRYSRIGTDDQLAVRIEVPEIAEMPSITQLSGGTADQAWLAVRLASVQLLEEGRESLPLFLDEPFAQFDETRAAAALVWLRDHAGDRQIFLFTCRERDRELALSVFGNRMTRLELLPV